MIIKLLFFFAGDGVNLLSCKKAGEVVGQGTGDLYDHLENLKNSKVSIYVSGLSIADCVFSGRRVGSSLVNKNES